MQGYIISNKNQISVENYEIQSFDILHKSNLNIFVIENNAMLYKNDIIENACFYGHVQVLEWFKNSGYEFNYNEMSINSASYYGHVQVLEWFKNSGYEFKYDEWAIINASGHGHIQVLEWFKNSGYEFKYDEEAITRASVNGHDQVLEWFKNSGYKFKYNGCAIYYTSEIKVLKFYSYTFNIKKLIKWSDNIFIKTIKFKTPQKYLKGYQKN
jgi:hypothetical protein